MGVQHLVRLIEELRCNRKQPRKRDADYGRNASASNSLNVEPLAVRVVETGTFQLEAGSESITIQAGSYIFKGCRLRAQL